MILKFNLPLLYYTLGNIKAEGFVVVIKDPQFTIHRINKEPLENGFHKHDELLNRDYSLVRG